MNGLGAVLTGIVAVVVTAAKARRTEAQIRAPRVLGSLAFGRARRTPGPV